MLTLIGISLFTVSVATSDPPNISGTWQGDDWGQVTLTQTAPGEYTGTYADTVVKDKGPGKIELKWSRIERRYNGTWREGDDDRFGDLSIRLVGQEIRGALTTSDKSKVNPGTPRLGDLVWTRTGANTGATVPHANAVQFDGEHYAKVAPAPKFTSGDFTISVWFNPVRIAGWSCLFMRGHCDRDSHGFNDQRGDIGLKLSDRDGDVLLQALTSPNVWIFGWAESRLRGPVRYGQWNHAVVTRRGDTYTTWMNGQRVRSENSSEDISDDDNSNPFLVGAFAKGGGAVDLYQGALDDLRIFRRCLSDKEIGTLYDRHGDAAALDGEGRVKIGPLIRGHDMNLPEGVRITPPAANAPHARAVQFDGQHYAKVEQPPKFTAGDLTISVWFNPVRTGDTEWLFMRGFGFREQPGDIGLPILRDGCLDFRAFTAANHWFPGWDPPPQILRSPVRYGQWSHVVVTRRGDTYTMWMNGKRVGSEESTADISDAGNTCPFLVGGMMGDVGAGGLFRGDIDDFRIFRRCLSDKEIGTLYDCNGDSAALDGEGRVKVGPLVTGRGAETDNAAHAHALQFDGASSYVDLGRALDFRKDSAFSVAFWMKSPYDTRQGQQMIVGKGAGFFHHNAPGWTVFTAHAGFVYFQLHGGSTPFVNELQAWDISTLVRDGRWHHVVVSYNGNRDLSGVAFFIDGKAKRLGSDSNNLRDGDIRNNVHATIGAPATRNDNFYQGTLSELHIFDRALTPADAAKLYAGGAGNYGAVGVSGLVAGYHLDEGRGTTVADFSGHGHDGTLHGGVEWFRGAGVLPSNQPPAANAPHARALHFDQLHYTMAPASTKFTSGNFTISLWLRPEAKGRRGPTVSQYIVNRNYFGRNQCGDFVLRINRLSGDLDFCLWGDDGGRPFWIFGWDVPETRMHCPVRFDEWNHVIITRSGETYAMWINGKRVVTQRSSANVSDADNTNPFTIGGAMSEQGVHELFRGDIDDFRTFLRCLSDDEIADLYKSNGGPTRSRSIRSEGRRHIRPLHAAYWKGELLPGESLPTSPSEDAPHAHALHLDQSHYADVPPSTKFTAGDFTMSLWLKPASNWRRSAVQSQIVVARNFGYRDQRGDVVLGIDRLSGQLDFTAFGEIGKRPDIRRDEAPGYEGRSSAYRGSRSDWIFGWDQSERFHSPINYDRWNHVAVTRSGDTYTMWVNGARACSERSSADISDAGNTNPFKIGTGSGAPPHDLDQSYLGDVDDFRVFRRCLSDKEMADLYKSNGDEKFLLGEGRVKLGPLVKSHLRGPTEADGLVPVPTRPAPENAPHAPALHFDGASGYVDLGPALNFKKDSAFSVSFWMNSTGVDRQMLDRIHRPEWRGKMNDNVDQQIVGKSAGFFDHGAPGWTVFTNKVGFLYFQLNASNQPGVSELQAYELRTGLCDARWHHVVVSYNGNQDVSGVAFYIDGASQPLGTDSNNLRAGDTRNEAHAAIGATSTGKGFYHGALSEVRIFDRALTAADAAKLHSDGIGSRGALEVSGLVAGYHLDEGRGTTVADFSGHGNNGTLHGDVRWVHGRGTAAGPHADAVQFDGRHYAKAEPPPKFTAGDFTISLWFNPVRSNHFAFPFMRGYSYRDQQGDIGLKLNVRSGDLDFQARTAADEWLFGWDAPESRLRSPVRYNQWNHVVVTRRGKTYTMWMNGARVGSEKSPADVYDAENTNPFIVGGIMEDNTVVDMFQGALDDFRIFRRCLSNREIGTLYDRNGDAGSLDGEGRVKLGPLCAAGGKQGMPNGANSPSGKEKVPQTVPPSEAVSQRIATLKELVRAVEADYELSGQSRLSDIFDAQDKLLDGQLEAAKSKAERVKIWEELLQWRQKMEKRAESLFKNGVAEGGKANFLQARAARQKAELGLAREKARSDEPSELLGEKKHETKWTPENIKKDPAGYLSWAIDQTNATKTKLEAAQLALAKQRQDLSDKLRKVSTDKSNCETVLTELKEAYKKANAKNDWPVVVRNHKFDSNGELKRKIIECNNYLENASKLVENYSTAKGKVTVRLNEIEGQRTKVETLRRQLATDLETAKVQQTLEGIDVSDGQVRIRSGDTTLKAQKIILGSNGEMIANGLRSAALGGPSGGSGPAMAPLRRFDPGFPVGTIALSPDGKLIAAASDQPSMIMMGGGHAKFADDWWPTVALYDAATARFRNNLKLTTKEEDALLADRENLAAFQVSALAFAPDGNMLAVGTRSGQVKLFNLPTVKLVRSLEDKKPKSAVEKMPEKWKAFKQAMGSIASLAFSPDGSTLAACGESFDDVIEIWAGNQFHINPSTGPGRLKLWDVKSGTLKEDLVGHSHANAVAFSPDGHCLASAGLSSETGMTYEAAAVLWNLETHKPDRKIKIDTKGFAQAVAFSPDSKLLAIGTQHFDKDKEGSTGNVALVHAATGIMDWSAATPGYVKPLAFSRDGKTVVVLCGGQSVRFLDAETGTLRREIRPEGSAQRAQWNDLAIGAKGDIMAIGGVDGTRKGSVELWDCKEVAARDVLGPTARSAAQQIGSRQKQKAGGAR